MGKVLFYTCRKFENNIFFVKIFYEKIKFPIRKKEKKKILDQEFSQEFQRKIIIFKVQKLIYIN